MFIHYLQTLLHFAQGTWASADFGICERAKDDCIADSSVIQSTFSKVHVLEQEKTFKDFRCHQENCETMCCDDIKIFSDEKKKETCTDLLMKIKGHPKIIRTVEPFLYVFC